MLCERPSNSQANVSSDPIPFRPANISREPLGISHPLRVQVERKQKPREALVKHRVWLRELQETKRLQETTVESQVSGEKETASKLRELSVNFHRTVLSGAETESKHAAWLDLTHAVGLSAPPMSTLALAERADRLEATCQENGDVERGGERVRSSFNATSALAPAAPPNVVANKPARYDATLIPEDKIHVRKEERICVQGAMQ